MLELLSNRIASFLVGVFPESDYDTYVYGAHKILSTGVAVAVTLAQALLFHCFWETLIFILSFLSVRKRTGGYHAETEWGCLLTFEVIFLFSVFFWNPLMNWAGTMNSLIIYCLSAMTLLAFAPVNHPNFDASVEEYVAIRKKMIVKLIIHSAIVVTVAILPVKSDFLHFFILGTFNTAILIAAAKLLKQEASPHEAISQTPDRIDG